MRSAVHHPSPPRRRPVRATVLGVGAVLALAGTLAGCSSSSSTASSATTPAAASTTGCHRPVVQVHAVPVRGVPTDWKRDLVRRHRDPGPLVPAVGLRPGRRARAPPDGAHGPGLEPVRRHRHHGPGDPRGPPDQGPARRRIQRPDLGSPGLREVGRYGRGRQRALRGQGREHPRQLGGGAARRAARRTGRSPGRDGRRLLRWGDPAGDGGDRLPDRRHRAHHRLALAGHQSRQGGHGEDRLVEHPHRSGGHGPRGPGRDHSGRIGTLHRGRHPGRGRPGSRRGARLGSSAGSRRRRSSSRARWTRSSPCRRGPTTTGHFALRAPRRPWCGSAADTACA